MKTQNGDKNRIYPFSWLFNFPFLKHGNLTISAEYFPPGEEASKEEEPVVVEEEEEEAKEVLQISILRPEKQVPFIQNVLYEYNFKLNLRR